MAAGRRRKRVSTDKPDYRVPSMDEIRALEPNGYKVISTFSGCGGSCLGLRMAGFKVLWASEFVDAARAVYSLNHPTSHLDHRDVRDVTAAEMMTSLGLKVGELDVLEGSPPCSSFSTAGSREKGWGKVKAYSDTKQRTDDLFFEYVRLLEGLQPRAFIAENVKGLVIGKAKGYFVEICARLRACGYQVAAKVLDASRLGVPQTRNRTIFIGFRNDLGLSPREWFPKPLPYRYSVKDACPWIGSSVVEAPDPGDPPTPTFRGMAIHAEWKKLHPGESSTKYFNLVRAPTDRPSPCVTATGASVGAASVTHPHEPRKFSIAELRRICSFPDDFQLVGSYAQQWERLGRSVPPLMMRAIGLKVRDALRSIDNG
jgi:DNA (cytosine-5)-methyltransferase 1